MPAAPKSGDRSIVAAIARNVKAARERSGLTQAKLGELVGLEPRSVQKIEAGDVVLRTTTLVRLRRALKCRWNDILPPDDER